MRILLLTVLTAAWIFAGVGRIAAVSGDAFLFRGATSVKVTTGLDVEEKDRVEAEKNGKFQILFKDKTILTIGSGGSLDVQEYMEESGKESVKLSVAKGFFKVITGAVGKAAPDKFKLSTKTSTIGIRGTHILGFVSDEFEKIACTKGAISVLANGATVELLEGQITEFKKGEMPKTPRDIVNEDIREFKRELGTGDDILSKIKSIRLDRDTHKPSKEQLDEIFSKIREIKDNEARIFALDMLESSLNEQLDAIYAGQYFKLDTTRILGDQSSQSIKFGYYTQQQVSLKNGKYAVVGSLFDSMTDAVNAAKPTEMYRDSKAVPTDSAVIAKKMGGSVGNIFSAWDGRGGDRTVATYSGKSIGLSKEGGLSAAFLQNEHNNAAITIDYGSRTVLGSFAFDVSSGGKIKSYNEVVSDAAVELVTPTSFFAANFAPATGSSKFLLTQLFYGRYYGNDANQISAYFETIANDVDPKKPAYDRDMLGLFVLNKVDEYSLGKHTKGSDEKFSWGYWAKSDFIENDPTSVLAAKPSGGWIAPKEGVAEIKKDELDALKTAQVKASFKADLIGTVAALNQDTQLIKNGKLGLDFDFGKGSLKGDMSFETGKDKWALSLKNGTLSDNGFKVTSFSTASDSSLQIKYQQIAGSFFGSKAEFIGGGFSLVESGGKLAVGAFKGAR